MAVDKWHVGNFFISIHRILAFEGERLSAKGVMGASILHGSDHDTLMASLQDMPVELILEIVKHVLNEDLMLPGVGQDAAWIIPPDSQILWTQKPAHMKRLSEIIPSLSSEIIDRGDQEIPSSHLHRPHCSLKALRETNRFFNEICRPFLYQQLNLLSDLTTMKRESMNNIFDIPIWPFIQSISVYMDPAEPLGPAQFKEQSTNVAYIIGECRNLTTLALYYRHAAVRTTVIRDAVFSLIKNGRLSSLGVYSSNLLRDIGGRDTATGTVPGVITLLERIALYGPAQRSLRVLDVVADYIPTNTFDLIRSKFTSLTSLTLRRVVRAPWYVSRIWDADQQPKWYSYPNLTRLQLSNIGPGHAAHIPPLVRHFAALKELKISACGTIDNFVGSPRTPGWSRIPDALYNNRPPLTTFHIEHMDDWELHELGVIPTALLIITRVKKGHLIRSFHKDIEIFPALRVLRLPLLSTDDRAEIADGVIDSNDVGAKPSIQAICRERNIELRRDVVSYKFTCWCNCEEGY